MPTGKPNEPSKKTLERFAFIVLHYKDVVMTQRCVSSIEKCAEEGDAIIVVDNSHDFTLDSPRVLTLKPDEYNPGFSRGMNVGARKARDLGCDFLTFVNNDTLFEANFRNQTAKTFARDPERIAAVGPKIVHLSHPDIIWSAGGYISSFRMTAIPTKSLSKSKNVKGVFFTEFLSGCVVTIQGKPFSSLGGWPEAYFFGGEDREVSKRLSDAGFKLAICADTTVYHESEVGSGNGRSHSIEDPFFLINGYLNRLVFSRRNFGFFRQASFFIILLLFVLFIMPLKWKSISMNHRLHKKIFLCIRLSKILFLGTNLDQVRKSDVREFVKVMSRLDRSGDGL